jgi:Spy/CpxP family protein refolding chaperone
MKQSKLSTVSTLVGLLMFTTVALSQTSKPALPSGYVTVPGGGWGTYEEMFKVCELTKDQLEKVAKIEALRVLAMKDKEKELKAAQDGYLASNSSKDPDVMAKAQAKYMELYNAVNAERTKAQNETLAVLTREQKAKWQEYTVLKSVKLWYGDIKFSEQQWDKIMALYEKLAKDPAVAEQNNLVNVFNSKVRDILTPEQKAKRLMATQYAWMDRACHFTKEQIEKLVKIEDERAKESADVAEKLAPMMAQAQPMWAKAYASGDPDASAAAQAQWAEIYKPYTDLNKKYQDKVQALLTEKQKTAWTEEQKKYPGLGQGGVWVGGGSGAVAPPVKKP